MDLSWSNVQDRPNERMEFGASHVREAWRKHKTPQQKFLGLERAFSTSDHRLTKLLQEVNANPNAQNHLERGQALFAAVWFKEPGCDWAILCNATHATLVQREEIEAIPVTKHRDEEVIARVQALFEEAPENLKRELDSKFYDRVLRPVQSSA